ncbi:unnamed protein product [Protopolystoma xenopodis]|uniref:Uncharacterized protein n=1 Tax=Protopolystoma xenopodis TaxID=117903 RepID=A0A3S5FCZ1_9PLAT|nr:unnamed protein product [Protopolystoma xenopodis]
MQFLNGYVSSQADSMRSFLRKISILPTGPSLFLTSPISNATDTSSGDDIAERLVGTAASHAACGASSASIQAADNSGLHATIDIGYELACLHTILVEVLFARAQGLVVNTASVGACSGRAPPAQCLRTRQVSSFCSSVRLLLLHRAGRWRRPVEAKSMISLRLII